MLDPLSTSASVATLTQVGIAACREVGRTGFMGRVCNFIRSIFRPYRIAVYGYSGSGKSSFLHVLKYGTPYPGDSTRHIEEVKLWLPNCRKVIFYDCPGQDLSDTYRRTISQKIAKGKIDAVINVVCYGYNDTGNSTLVIFDNEGRVKEEYLEEMRGRELTQLEEWHNVIDHTCRLKWLLTLVNKADVWWHRREEAISYYSDRQLTYGKKIHEFSRLFKTPIILYCSTFSRFGGRDMPLLFDEKDQRTMQRKVLEDIQYLIDHES